ncbi:unnamed protein product [Phyllotreta striolata]|uniref:PPIase cyclophilin-type domain-containing protein n=1 Tax=Phyllotreta striolata TaxID=444603 RepID=A0A9N9XJI0_PHYSR|nr:unnamed protein product [Phyllotreta striolata]
MAAETQHKHAYLDLHFDGVKAGRVIIELFDDVAPKTVENFRALCTGEKGIGKSGKPLHYKGIKFHKVVPMCMVQCGDIVNNNGTGGESIYGDSFEDENYIIKHDKEGIVGMVNMGKNLNQSQFYITTQPCFHLDDTNVAFGRVVKGLNLLVEMADQPRYNVVPLGNLTIGDCGELKPDEPWNYHENDGTEDQFPPWPDDWEQQEQPDDPVEMENVLISIKNSGNHFYNSGDFPVAERKYLKCLRYIDWFNKKINAMKSEKEKTANGGSGEDEKEKDGECHDNQKEIDGKTSDNEEERDDKNSDKSEEKDERIREGHDEESKKEDRLEESVMGRDGRSVGAAFKNTVLMNLATAQLKMRKYKEAVKLCSQIIKEERGKCGKVYYRRAQAMLQLKEYDKALNDLNEALTFFPNDKQIIFTLNKAKKSKLSYLKKERAFFSKLFN